MHNSCTLLLFSKIIFHRRLFSDCWGKVDYPVSIIYLSCFACNRQGKTFLGTEVKLIRPCGSPNPCNYIMIHFISVVNFWYEYHGVHYTQFWRVSVEGSFVGFCFIRKILGIIFQYKFSLWSSLSLYSCMSTLSFMFIKHSFITVVSLRYLRGQRCYSLSQTVCVNFFSFMCFPYTQFYCFTSFLQGIFSC